MSKLILICHRSAKRRTETRSAIASLSKRLIPDNIDGAPPVIIENNGLSIGIVNPIASLPIHGSSVCLGILFGDSRNWWKPGADAPDGNYALFRSDTNQVELVTDIVASRTIWYVIAEDIFVASTSQRAIISILQSYEPNESVYPWMMSSGNLGPGLSWDRRIHCLGGDARLRLDRASWQFEIRDNPVVFSPIDCSENEHERRLREALKETFESLAIDCRKWVLPLSGGCDSRAILQRLKGCPGLKTITWGTKASKHDKYGDACVAARFAETLGVKNEYFETDLSADAVDRILDRFLVAGEGRSDHISGYTDGFAIWKRLFESDIYGVLRGDQVFGWRPAANQFHARRSLGITYLSDFSNLVESAVFNLYEQKIPESLRKRCDETLETYRDRLQQTFRAPVILAALNDLKCSYVEIINPLLSRRVVAQIRTMPDYLRTGKRLFKKIVSDGNPGIPFAEHTSIESTINILKNGRVSNCILSTLRSSHAENILSSGLASFLINNIDAKKQSMRKQFAIKNYARSLINKFAPQGTDKWLRLAIADIRNNAMTINIDMTQLAFRAYIICKMDKLLNEDAQALGAHQSVQR